MLASSIRHRAIVLGLALAISLAAAEGIAESPAPAASPTVSAASSAPSGANDFGDVTLSSPAIQPGSPPPQNLDRQRSSAQATALAASVASMQRMACIALMLNPLTIPAALMECAQAAETEANARKNRQAERQNRDENATPKQPQLTLSGAFELKNQSKQDEPLLPELSAEPTPDASPLALEPLPETSPSPSEAVEPVPSQAATAEGPAPKVEEPAPKPRALQPIDQARLGYDQSGRESSKPAPTSPGYPPPSRERKAERPMLPFEPDSRESMEGARTVSLEKPTEKRAHVISPESGSGAGVEEARDSSLDTGLELINRLLGGPPSGESPREAAAADVIILPAKKDDTRNDPNIFEYASWRYRKIAHPDPGVRVRARREAAVAPGRILANSID